MQRNIKKLIMEYEKRHIHDAKTSRTTLYAGDFYQIRDIALAAGGTHADEIYNAIDAALKAGIMIGYKARAADEKKKAKSE